MKVVLLILTCHVFGALAFEIVFDNGLHPLAVALFVLLGVPFLLIEAPAVLLVYFGYKHINIRLRKVLYYGLCCSCCATLAVFVLVRTPTSLCEHSALVASILTVAAVSFLGTVLLTGWDTNECSSKNIDR